MMLVFVVRQVRLLILQARTMISLILDASAEFYISSAGAGTAYHSYDDDISSPRFALARINSSTQQAMRKVCHLLLLVTPPMCCDLYC